MATVTPSNTPFTLDEAMRFYKGDISDNPEFSGYWSLYGDPPDSQDWWVQNNQPTQQATNWFRTAQAGGNQTAAQQAAADKDGLLGGLGPLARIAAMIPSPIQPFAAGASALDSASQGDWLGALGAGYGAYSGFTSPSFKNPISGIGDLFKGSSANMETGAYSPGGVSSSITEYNTPNQFGAWSSDGMNGLGIGNEGDWYGTGDTSSAVGNESDWFSGMSPSQISVSNGGTMPDTTGGGGGLSGLLKQIFGGGGAPGSYQFPWGTAISSLLGFLGNKEQSKDLNGLMQQIMAAQDPFASQRPQYQKQLSGLASNPSNFFSDPAISQAIKSAMDQSNRSLVAQGYNSSGNQMAELTKVAQNEAFKQYLPFLQQIGGFAGAGFGPGNMAGAGAVGQAGAAATNQGIGNLGVGLQSVLSGQQPTLLDILKNTPEGGSILEAIKRTPQNQSLVDVFKNALG